MRARALKPGLFKNELLGQADPLITILFQGLWCVADREGRLEDRPLRLCGEIFPHRRRVTEKQVDSMLRWLHDMKFITRYKLNEKAFIQVCEFGKHQTPHVNERPSQIPSLNGISHCAEHSTRTGSEPEPVPPRIQALRSDSGLLTPDSSFQENPPTPLGKGGHGASALPNPEPQTQPAPKPEPPRRLRRERRNGYEEPAPIVTHDQRERRDLDELMARREAIGIAGFRDPRPGESASQYRSAQDAEWTQRRERGDRKGSQRVNA